MRQESAQQREMTLQLHARLSSVDARLISLEDKVDARLRETRPVWEGVQQRLTGIETELNILNRQLGAMIADTFQLRVCVENWRRNRRRKER